MHWKYLLLLLITCTLSACHVGRFFVFNFADSNDHKKFPKIAVEKDPSKSIFQFASQADALTRPLNLTINGKEYTKEQWMKKTGTIAFMIIQDDSIALEIYNHPQGAETIVPSFSVAKSYTSALLGIAIAEGYIDSVQQSVRDLLPELPEDPFQAITLEHLLNMRSGLNFKESYVNPFGHVAKFYYGTNLKQFTKKLKAAHPPGKKYHYSSGDTFILGWAIEAATKQKLPTYLQEKIWKPLGMEYDASWSVDSRKHQMTKAFCCINARAHDFAKFGRLYLNYGQWEGQPIVPQEWVTTSTDFSTVNGRGYKYQWWKKRSDFNDDFFAQGILGQFIYVNRDKNIVMVRLGRKYGKMSWPTLFQLLAQKM
ncbi:MAG: serine hydrolase domain-containing protein [Aureispira sp.]